jgi:hypothetical protein
MELKRLIERFAYRIEPKPEGGFIARASDPTVPQVEAATREELQQKLQDYIATALRESSTTLTFPVQTNRAKFQVHIDRKPGGGFTVRSEEQGTPQMDLATHQKLDHLAERVLGFVDKNFPELAAGLTQAAGSAGKRSTDVGPNGAPQVLVPTPFSKDVFSPNAKGKTADNTTFDPAALDNTPITAEKSSLGSVVRFALVLLALAGLVYFFVQRF